MPIDSGTVKVDDNLSDGVVSMRFPQPQSRLSIADGMLLFELTQPLPCRWWRFWQWALLGWRWVDLRETDE